MKKLILALLLVLVPVAAQADPSFQTLTTTYSGPTNTGAWASMPIDTQSTTYASAVSVTFTTLGNSSNRTIFECSNDVTFTNDGSIAGPANVSARFVGQVNTVSPGSGTVSVAVGRTFIFPTYARYCRLFETTWVAGTDTAIVSLVPANTGPIVVEQGTPTSNLNSSWPVITGAYPGIPANNVVATPTIMANSGSTGAVTVALAATSNRTTYVCGFDVSAIGGTAAVGPITVGQVAGGFTLTYQASSSAAGIIISKTFTPCLPAAAPNTQIFGTTTADGTASAVNFSIYGFTY